jgi:isopentenyl diphosphate isomerase/L-lactate dehydrogenase-like FMN-dependent dehydrogenase
VDFRSACPRLEADVASEAACLAGEVTAAIVGQPLNGDRQAIDRAEAMLDGSEHQITNVLAGVETIDMSTTVMEQRLAMPLFCSPTARQRLFHHDGERAVAKAAEKFGTMFGVSSLGTVSVEEIGAAIATPKMFQLYFHKDRGLS